MLFQGACSDYSGGKCFRREEPLRPCRTPTTVCGSWGRWSPCLERGCRPRRRGTSSTSSPGRRRTSGTWGSPPGSRRGRSPSTAARSLTACRGATSLSSRRASACFWLSCSLSWFSCAWSPPGTSSSWPFASGWSTPLTLPPGSPLCWRWWIGPCSPTPSPSTP